MNEILDEDLIRQYKSGDTTALDLLFSRYKAIVSSTARAYFLTGGSNEDLVQEGMIGLHRAIVTYDESKNVPFNIFAKTCIKSSILDALKIATRDKHRMLNDSVPLEDVTHEEDSKRSPEEVVLGEENVEILRDEINSFLSSPQRQLLDLYLEGCTYQEIADTMKKDTKYVDNTLQIIKRKIRKNLNIDK